MADKPFRVLLDLTDLHIDILKYVWINVSPHELKTVADFKASVIRKINLDKVDIQLFVRNGLLLDDETVMILRENDTVKVQYHSQHQSGNNHTEKCVKESRKSSRKRSHDESDLSLIAKKCKRESKFSTQEKELIYFVEMSDKKGKKRKNSPSVCSQNLHNEAKTLEVSNPSAINFHNKNEKQTSLEKNITDFNLQQKYNSFFSFDNQDSGEENKTLKTVNFESSSLKIDSAAKDSLPVNDISLKPEKEIRENCDFNTITVKKSETIGNNCPKKKRKRRKKRKQALESVEAFDNTEVIRDLFTNATSESVQRKHVVYSPSPSKNGETLLLDSDDKIGRSKNLTMNTFVMDEVESEKTLEPYNVNHPKISTPAQSDFCKNPNLHLSQMQRINLNSNHNETIGFIGGKNRNLISTKFADKQGISFDNPKSSETTLEVCYTDLPPINSRPDIGAHIAYKILELDEHYSPVISDYREGIVKSINLDNEEIEIELLKHEIKPGRIGKFENLKEDEVPLPEIKTSDIVKWSSLVEPRLIG